jgi:transcriptional regulator GlxA family with amidase domain
MTLQRDTATTLGFLLFPGFPMACLTSAIEPLRAANEITGRREFSWRLIGEEAEPVRSSAEVRFDPDVTLTDATGLDYLFFLSAPNFKTPNAAKRRCVGWTVQAWFWVVFPAASSRFVGRA